MMEKELQEIRCIFADLHMGEGPLKNGKPNSLEMFDIDIDFSRAIDRIIKSYGNQKAKFELDLNGDTFDFLRVEYNGRIKAEPTEDAAIEQIKKIFLAHPLVIESFKKVLRHGGRIKFFIGNHDLALVWPNVQNFIRRELTKGWSWQCNEDPLRCIWNDNINAWERIKFVFEETKDGVFISHGNNAEPNNTVHPEKVFFTKRAGKLLIPPLLRHPYGSHLITDQANVFSRGTRLFKGNWWIGRLEPHWFIFFEAVMKNKWFTFWAALIWFFTPLRHRFSRRWWVRKSASLLTLAINNWDSFLVAAYNKLRGKDYTDYAKKILAERKNVDIVVCAHIHLYARHTTKNGTIIFTGNLSTTYDGEMTKPDLKWKKFRRIEKIIKYFALMRKMFNPKTSHLYTPQKRDIISFGICEFFGDGYKKMNLMKYNKEKDCLEEIN